MQVQGPFQYPQSPLLPWNCLLGRQAEMNEYTAVEYTVREYVEKPMDTFKGASESSTAGSPDFSSIGALLVVSYKMCTNYTKTADAV